MMKAKVIAEAVTGALTGTSWARLKIGLILTLILLVTVFHYQTSTERQYLHEIYQRVYYIPILLAAFWYGPIGGAASALLTSGLYYYHIRLHWLHLPVYSFNQYAEIILYHVVALIIGFLSLRERRHRAALERTSEELSRAYRKVQDSFEQLKRADRLAALGQLSAGVAHEIRNPLGSIKGSIEILESDFPEDHPKREFVDIIKEETARLNSIVAEFLKFAKPPRPSAEPTSVTELVDSTLILLQKQAENSRTRIQKTLSPRLPTLEVDRDQIRQVLLNVMLNGIEAMPEGGVLQVTGDMDAGGDGVTLEVSDTGQGLEENLLDHVFDPFFTTKPQGTGLGLSISYQLIQNHGGRITARKNPDRGLTFRIELPLTSSPMNLV
jgi:signal transduction histidine kinase